MASYLFKAPPQQMAYWKVCAEKAGMSFAAWLREAADQHAGSPTAEPVVSSQDARRYAGTGSKKTFEPDPK